MRYKSFEFNGEQIENDNDINSILKDHKFFWLVDSEFEDAEIELIRDTIIWKSGNYLHGSWKYGIWLMGTFYGKWLNGIFEDGDFKGNWISGIDNRNKK